jgi:hypothetical protein
MVFDQAFEGGAWLVSQKKANLEGLQLLKEVLDIKTMLNENSHLGRCHGCAKAE